MVQNLTARIPLFDVRAIVICLYKKAEEYIDGKRIPCTKISEGHIYVHGTNILDARARASRILEETYEGFSRVDFLNTHKTRESDVGEQGFPGLDMIN